MPIATDFTAYLLSAHKAAAERMKDKGDIDPDRLDVSAHLARAGARSIYAGMKAGIEGFAEALRKELGRQGHQGRH